MEGETPTVSISYDKASYNDNVIIKGDVRINCSMEIPKDQFEDIAFRSFVEGKIQDTIFYQMRKAPLSMNIRRTGFKRMVDGIIFECEEDISDDEIRAYIKRIKDILGHDCNFGTIRATVHDEEIEFTTFTLDKKTIKLLPNDVDWEKLLEGKDVS